MIFQPPLKLSIIKNIITSIKAITFCFALVILAINCSFGQQDAIYVTYPTNPLAINPAYAGSSGVANITILVRKQSLVLQNVGSSQYLSYNTPLANGKAGLGFQAYNASFGQIGNNGSGFNMSGSYRHHFSDSISISIGGQVGLAQVPSVFAAAQYKTMAGFGAYFRTFNSYFGVAMPVLTKIAYNSASKDKNYYPRYIFVSAGHVLNINEMLDLKLGVMFKQANDKASSAVDINAVLWYKKAFGIGVWKNNSGSEVNPKSAIIISLEGQINPKFRIGFSMDAASKGAGTRINPTTGRSSNLGLYNLMLRYDFDNLTGKINNFRFF
jgi:type IX secretion system PorP/SprF family membrane protein